jgi:hypothetical protein
MFQFPPCPPTGLCVQPVVTEYCSAGFPHSGISGSTFDDNSPELIAAIRALLRLLAPRHPPHALSSLIHVRRQHLIIETYLLRPDKSRAQHVASYFYSAQLLRCSGAYSRTGRLTTLRFGLHRTAWAASGCPQVALDSPTSCSTLSYPPVKDTKPPGSSPGAPICHLTIASTCPYSIRGLPVRCVKSFLG